MKRFPQIRTRGFSDDQRSRLEGWLAQWRLDQGLRRLSGESLPTEARKAAVSRETSVGFLIAPFSEEPTTAVGQIRLLAPTLTPAGRGPVYVAVLRETESGCWLIAPFSKFQTPTLPHEILLRESPLALTVLCLWNARPVSGFVLGQSWYVGQLSQTELTDSLVVCSLAGRKDPIPDRLASRVGPPAYDPTDPRFDYMNQEGEIWRHITSFPANAEHAEIVHLPAFQDVTIEGAILLAAESQEAFVRVSTIEVGPQQLLVHVFARPRGRALFLVVTNMSGESSGGLDMALVSLRSSGLAGEIRLGQCVIRTDDPTELVVRQPSGPSLPVVKVGEALSIRPFSYVRLIEMLGSDEDAVSVLTDSELERLILNCPRDTKIDVVVMAEGYFRAWLYESSSRQALRDKLACYGDPKIDALLDGVLATVRTRQNWTGDVAADAEMHGRSRSIWERLASRIHSFIRADGVIPVVTGETAEAIPIAFNLRTNEAPGSVLRDIKGIPMPLWDEAEEIFGDLLAQHIGVQLQCSTRGTGRQFDGESFELPIVLALARKRGSLPDFPALSVIASGAIRGDAVKAVSGIDAKTAMARRMGVRVFVVPGAADDDVVMGAPESITIQDIVRKLAARLECVGLDRLDTRTAAARLNSLGDEIHLGTVPLSDAAERLNHYERALELDRESRIAVEGLIRAKVLRGAIANHLGDPQAGAKATRDAAGLAADARMPLLYVNAMANRIVSLTDLGYLKEAEGEGRRLLEWVLKEFSGSSAEQMQAEMVACGVVGGQPLLHMAVRGAECGPESLRLLLRALEIAQELQLPADICRDAVQVALWSALLEPVRLDTEVQKAYAVLNANAGAWSAGSLAHLRRVYLLGLYRASLHGQGSAPSFSALPLPDADAPSRRWVRATSQKYRGVLFVQQGQLDAAEKDFAEAWATLDREPAPLLRFIGATAALAAGEAMMSRNQDLADMYLEKARSVFSVHADLLEGPVRGSVWLQRTEGVLKRSAYKDLPDPQRFYPH